MVSVYQAPVSPPPVPLGDDWPQIGQNPQRTNYTSEQVNPPYCYTWKWYEAPIASRAQPVVAEGRLFVGSMDGILYARNASTGAPLWEFQADGPIRHSAGVAGEVVIFSSYDGYTYALKVSDGSLSWKTFTGSSTTAPLIQPEDDRAYVGSTNGMLTALQVGNGAILWKYDSGAPILTTPSLSQDGRTVFLGNEAIYAIAVDASSGAERWRTRLQGQSLADRYPVVAGEFVVYRSQPLYNFHLLLHEGDDVMDQAGALDPNWQTDWNKVRPQILGYLNQQPSKQTYFVLEAANGSSRGTAPVLYTYGNNDIPNMPVVRGSETFLTYRARHGIQTDSGTVHVTTQYDAELGTMDLSTLDIVGLTSNQPMAGTPQFRMTSDEPAMLSMGGSILWVDNWERLGGLNVDNGDLNHIGAVSNDWPECFTQCGPGTDNPFFPMSGSGDAYPFPSPRVNEGHARSGVVIANGMIYWRVIAGGIAGISHRSGSNCPAPIVWNPAIAPSITEKPVGTAASTTTPNRSLQDYVSLDLTTPVNNPPEDLISRLRVEVHLIVETGDHLMPYYLERGFSRPHLWPHNTTNPCSPDPCLPLVQFINTGNVFWQDPGELLLSMAMAFPYLDTGLQSQVKTYMAAEMQRYPPLRPLPWSGPPNPPPTWLVQGQPRELYEVPFRNELHNWPPPAQNLSVLYALWLWSKNTGDWSYAQNRWSEIESLFSASKNSILYYADIAGAIGYTRLAEHFGNSDAYNAGMQVSLAGMQSGLDFNNFRQRAESQYLDPRDIPSGWSAPVFFGLTPEVGLYLSEQLGGQAHNYLFSKENGDSLRWWFLTRSGVHAEAGESSYLSPLPAWSHFMAHAYISQDNQALLRKWLDRPWSRGDLYSIQKIVAAIQAP